MDGFVGGQWHVHPLRLRFPLLLLPVLDLLSSEEDFDDFVDEFDDLVVAHVQSQRGSVPSQSSRISPRSLRRSTWKSSPSLFVLSIVESLMLQ